jgi:predicted nucleic acid-binding protein
MLGIQAVPITEQLVHDATQLIAPHELLMGDALVVAVMHQHGLTHLASLDDDFDRVPGITGYAPV